MADIDATPRSADLLVKLLLAPGVFDRVKVDPATELPKLAEQAVKSWPVPAMVGDRIVWRIVVSALGLVAIGVVAGSIFLASRVAGTATATVPDVLTALGSAAIGALAGLLAPSPVHKG